MVTEPRRVGRVGRVAYLRTLTAHEAYAQYFQHYEPGTTPATENMQRAARSSNTAVRPASELRNDE